MYVRKKKTVKSFFFFEQVDFADRLLSRCPGFTILNYASSCCYARTKCEMCLQNKWKGVSTNFVSIHVFIFFCLKKPTNFYVNSSSRSSIAHKRRSASANRFLSSKMWRALNSVTCASNSALRSCASHLFHYKIKKKPSRTKWNNFFF